jgi:hypothetical protein
MEWMKVVRRAYSDRALHGRVEKSRRVGEDWEKEEVERKTKRKRKRKENTKKNNKRRRKRRRGILNHSLRSNRSLSWSAGVGPTKDYLLQVFSAHAPTRSEHEAGHRSAATASKQ